MIIKKRELLKLDLQWETVTVRDCSRFFRELEMENRGDAEIEFSSEYDGDSRLFMRYEREETDCERRHREAEEATSIIRAETDEILEYKRLKRKYEG